MAKRSTNFNGGKKPIKPASVLSLMQWVGMTDEEIQAALKAAAAKKG
jgi:hypothetical protein